MYPLSEVFALNKHEVFELIKTVIKNNNFKNIVSYLCKTANISRSGYYNYIKSEKNYRDLIKGDGSFIKTFRLCYS